MASTWATAGSSSDFEGKVSAFSFPFVSSFLNPNLESSLIQTMPHPGSCGFGKKWIACQSFPSITS